MTGRELIAKLSQLPDDSLDKPVYGWGDDHEIFREIVEVDDSISDRIDLNLSEG